MIHLTINGDRISYDSIDDAREAARASGLGVKFWRETLKACESNDGAWNEFLNELFDSGDEDLANRLLAGFDGFEHRHWMLVAAVVNGNNLWNDFLETWSDSGASSVLPVVKDCGFMPWLQNTQPLRYAIMQPIFGVKADRFDDGCLFAAFLRIEAEKLQAGVDEHVRWFALCVKDAFLSPIEHGPQLIEILEREKCWLLEDEKKHAIDWWAKKSGIAEMRAASEILSSEDYDVLFPVLKGLTYNNT